MPNLKWDELSPRAQASVAALCAVEVALTSFALIDLWKRDPSLVRGPKILWAAGVFVQPIGPVAYLLAGRAPSGG